MAKVDLKVDYAFPREQVWEVLTNSACLRQWLMDNNFKPMPGLKFQFRAKADKNWRGFVEGEVHKADPPSRLVYTWEGEPGKKTRVTWTLEAAGDNSTRVRLEHEGFHGLGGFILAKLVFGPGWKKLLTANIPMLLEHIRTRGKYFEEWVIPVNARLTPDGRPRA
jgi:uncharacterized protein YndB with AHSA1/START domain